MQRLQLEIQLDPEIQIFGGSAIFSNRERVSFDLAPESLGVVAINHRRGQMLIGVMDFFDDPTDLAEKVNVSIGDGEQLSIYLLGLAHPLQAQAWDLAAANEDLGGQGQVFDDGLDVISHARQRAINVFQRSSTNVVSPYFMSAGIVQQVTVDCGRGTVAASDILLQG